MAAIVDSKAAHRIVGCFKKTTRQAIRKSENRGDVFMVSKSPLQERDVNLSPSSPSMTFGVVEDNSADVSKLLLDLKRELGEERAQRIVLAQNLELLESKIKVLEEQNPTLYLDVGGSRSTACFGILEFLHQEFLTKGVVDHIKNTLLNLPPEDRGWFNRLFVDGPFKHSSSFLTEQSNSVSKKVSRGTYEELVIFWKKNNGVVAEEIEAALAAGEQSLLVGLGVTQEELVSNGTSLRSMLEEKLQAFRKRRNQECHVLQLGTYSNRKKVIEDIESALDNSIKITDYEDVTGLLRAGCTAYRAAKL